MHKTIGVIGSGSFGMTVAKLLSENVKVLLFTRRDSVMEAINERMKRRLETEGGGLTVDGGGGATITAWVPREADEHGDSATGVEVVA